MSADTEYPELSAKGQFLIYAAEDGRIKIDVRLENETVWLTQQNMADLLQVGVPTINYHLKEVFDSGELKSEATIRKFRIVRPEGTREGIVSRGSDIRRGQIIRAEGPVAYQPGATPQVCGYPNHQGLKARPIRERFHKTSGVVVYEWNELSALGFIFPSIPGALPQAGIRTHLWCCKPSTASELDTTNVNNVKAIPTHKNSLLPIWRKFWRCNE